MASIPKAIMLFRSTRYHLWNHRRFLGGTSSDGSVMKAWEKSCYRDFDYTIPEGATVYDAVQKFAAYDVGALLAVDNKGSVTGIISERDYIKKIALLGKTSKATSVKEVSTQVSQLIIADKHESVDRCMDLMMYHHVRHLPIQDQKKKIIGMVSIKDLIKVVVEDKEKTIQALSDLVLGKGISKLV